MPTRPTATHTATRIWREQFPGAVALFCGGSVARGEGTPHSDLDIVVLFEAVPNPWRESQVVDDWPVELFVHDLETLTYFVEQDCFRRQPSLASMLANATVIPKSTTLSDSVQTWATEILKTPPPVSTADLDAERYFVTDLLDDLRDERPRSEMVAIAARLHDLLGSLILKSRGRWSGAGKHLPRRLRELDPTIATAFQSAFDALFVDSQPAPLIAFAEGVLEPLGGTLFAGYRSDALPTARSTPPDLAQSSISSELLATDGVVTLTRFESADVSTMVEGDRDPEHRRRFGFPSDFVASAEHSAAVLAKWNDDWVRGDRYTFAVRDSVDGTLLGGCELQPRPSGEANLSYWTYPAFRRRGVASRAVALLAKTAFEVFGVTTLEILTAPDNTASRSVADRSGFVPKGSRYGQLLFIAEKSPPRS